MGGPEHFSYYRKHSTTTLSKVANHACTGNLTYKIIKVPPEVTPSLCITSRVVRQSTLLLMSFVVLTHSVHATFYSHMTPVYTRIFSLVESLVNAEQAAVASVTFSCGSLFLIYTFNFSRDDLRLPGRRIAEGLPKQMVISRPSSYSS